MSCRPLGQHLAEKPIWASAAKTKKVVVESAPVAVIATAEVPRIVISAQCFRQRRRHRHRYLDPSLPALEAERQLPKRSRLGIQGMNARRESLHGS